MLSGASFEFEFRDVFGLREQVSCTLQNKVKFQINLETVDVPLFGNNNITNMSKY